jgi:hypothetical protein
MGTTCSHMASDWGKEKAGNVGICVMQYFLLLAGNFRCWVSPLTELAHGAGAR